MKHRKSNLEDWIFTKEMKPSERKLQVSVYLRYPKVEDITHIELNDRKKYRDNFLKKQLETLLKKIEFAEFNLIGSKKSPRGIKTAISLAELPAIAKLVCVGNVYIEKVQHARKPKVPQVLEFFCVKMTVAIQIEGVVSGMQTYEERYVLVKAKDYEDAYHRVAKQEKSYAEPYLNSDCRLVRWKIESYDDCFSTCIKDTDSFNEHTGNEVFSVLKSRKLNKDRSWSP